MKSQSWLLIALAGLSLPVAVQAAPFAFSGTARASDGTTLYEEHHRITGRCTSAGFQPEAHTVNYLRPGEPDAFATKTLSYDQVPFQPAVDFRQPDFGEALEIRYPADGRVRIEWQPPSGPLQTDTLNVTGNLVVDSGFDPFIRANWQTLMAGDSVTFEFLAPTRAEQYTFRVTPISNGWGDALVIELRPAGFLLGLVVDPIELGYNEKGALVNYSGLTNIRKNSDTNHTARIRYTVSGYPPCPLVNRAG